MNKERLEQYKSLEKEIPMLKKKIDKLYKKQEKLSVVSGKVKASSKEFPYIEGHVTVEMHEPKALTELKKQIMINEKRMLDAESEKTAIESFVAGIPNSTDRMIIELVYLKGKSCTEVGKILGYTKGRISQKISNILKD